MGSIKRNKEFLVHPNAIKQELQRGEVFFVTKVCRFRREKVSIKL